MNFLSWLIILCNIALISTSTNSNENEAETLLNRTDTPIIGPRIWKAGIDCVEGIVNVFFETFENLTRSQNLVMASTRNMTTVAHEIQDGFLKYLHGLFNDNPKKRHLRQLRSIYTSKPMEVRSLMGTSIVYADFYVIVADSVDVVENMITNFVTRSISWNPGALYLIVYHNIDEYTQLKQNTLAIFDIFRRYNMLAVGVLYATNSTSYKFHTLIYFANKPCRTLGLKYVCDCKDGKIPSLVFARSILRTGDPTYLNCTINACASFAPPFVDYDCVLGIEQRIIGFMKNRIGFQLNTICTDETRGVKLDNGTYTGLLKQLDDYECDLLFGGYYPDNDVNDRFWVTDSYLSDKYTFFVKLAGERPAYIALYTIFQPLTWLCFMFVLMITCSFWYIFAQLLPESREQSHLSLIGINNLGVSICYAINMKPLCTPTQILFLFIALYGLNVTCIYTSKLIDIFQNPGLLHQIDTIEEVFQMRMPFGGSEEIHDWFENDHDLWIFNNYNSSPGFEESTLTLAEVAKGNRAVLASRKYVLQNQYSDLVHGFHKDVFSSPMNIILKPGFIFTLEFNLYIRYMRDLGIFNKIENDFIFNNTYLNRIARMRPEFIESAVVLSIDNMQGPFTILIIGIISSSIAFIGEHLWFRSLQYRWQKSRLRKKMRKHLKHKRFKKLIDYNNKMVQTFSAKKRKDLLKMRRKQRDRLPHLLRFKEIYKNTQNTQYDVNVIRPVRFTPLNRRKVY